MMSACWLLVTLAMAVFLNAPARAHAPCGACATVRRNTLATASIAAEAARLRHAFDADGAAKCRENCAAAKCATDLAAFVDADGAVSLFHCLLPGAFVAKAAAVLEASAAAARDAKCAVVVDTSLDRRRFEFISYSFSEGCPRDDANASLYCAVTMLEAAGDKSSSALVWRGKAGTAWLVATVVTAAFCLLSGTCGVDVHGETC